MSSTEFRNLHTVPFLILTYITITASRSNGDPDPGSIPPVRGDVPGVMSIHTVFMFPSTRSMAINSYWNIISSIIAA